MYLRESPPLTSERINRFFDETGALLPDLLEKDGLAEECFGLPGLRPEVQTLLRSCF